MRACSPIGEFRGEFRGDHRRVPGTPYLTLGEFRGHHTLRILPGELLESAVLDGHGPWGQLWHVILPLSRRVLAAAWCVAFVLGFGELPATNLLQPPGITTITFRIWTLLHTGVESHLAGVALVTLAVLAIAALAAVLGLKLLLSSDR